MDYITKLLGLQEAKIENIEENDEKIVISLVMNRKSINVPAAEPKRTVFMTTEFSSSMIWIFEKNKWF